MFAGDALGVAPAESKVFLGNQTQEVVTELCALPCPAEDNLGISREREVKVKGISALADQPGNESCDDIDGCTPPELPLQTVNIKPVGSGEGHLRHHRLTGRCVNRCLDQHESVT